MVLSDEFLRCFCLLVLLATSSDAQCQCGIFLSGRGDYRGEIVMEGAVRESSCQLVARSQCKNTCRATVAALTGGGGFHVVPSKLSITTKFLACHRFDDLSALLPTEVPSPADYASVHVSSDKRKTEGDGTPHTPILLSQHQTRPTHLVDRKADEITGQPRPSGASRHGRQTIGHAGLWLEGYYRWCLEDWEKANVTSPQTVCCLQGQLVDCRREHSTTKLPFRTKFRRSYSESIGHRKEDSVRRNYDGWQPLLETKRITRADMEDNGIEESTRKNETEGGPQEPGNTKQFLQVVKELESHAKSNTGGMAYEANSTAMFANSEIKNFSVEVKPLFMGSGIYGTHSDGFLSRRRRDAADDYLNVNTTQFTQITSYLIRSIANIHRGWYGDSATKDLNVQDELDHTLEELLEIMFRWRLEEVGRTFLPFKNVLNFFNNAIYWSKLIFGGSEDEVMSTLTDSKMMSRAYQPEMMMAYCYAKKLSIHYGDFQSTGRTKREEENQVDLIIEALTVLENVLIELGRRFLEKVKLEKNIPFSTESNMMSSMENETSFETKSSPRNDSYSLSAVLNAQLLKLTEANSTPRDNTETASDRNTRDIHSLANLHPASSEIPKVLQTTNLLVESRESKKEVDKRTLLFEILYFYLNSVFDLGPKVRSSQDLKQMIPKLLRSWFLSSFGNVPWDSGIAEMQNSFRRWKRIQDIRRQGSPDQTTRLEERISRVLPTGPCLVHYITNRMWYFVTMVTSEVLGYTFEELTPARS